MSGTVSSEYIQSRYPIKTFLVRLDERIEGIPEELLVVTRSGVLLRKGDRVLLKGYIFLYKNNIFGRDSIEILAKHLYNETLGCGG